MVGGIKNDDVANDSEISNQTRAVRPLDSRNGGRLKTGVRALRYRNFQLFFSGQLISLVGTWMQSVAQAWLVYRITGSPLLLGSVGFASQFPVFLIAPFGGTVADRANRHRVIIATQTLSMILAFILAGLTLTGKVQVWHIFVLASLLGVINAFDIPARQAFLVDMVGKEDLMNAIALNSSMFNGARIVGPAIAGILVAKIGEGWCFFANGVSYIAVIIGLLMMKIQCTRRAPSSLLPRGPSPSTTTCERMSTPGSKFAFLSPRCETPRSAVRTPTTRPFSTSARAAGNSKKRSTPDSSTFGAIHLSRRPSEAT